MFFPCTMGDEIKVFDGPAPKAPEFSISNMFVGDKDDYKHKYLDKSTIIMCNPNALIYQWMITSANAYWLDFFLRRDCNVLIWNYRGYGGSQQSIFNYNHEHGLLQRTYR